MSSATNSFANASARIAAALTMSVFVSATGAAQARPVTAHIEWVFANSDSAYYQQVVVGPHGTTLALTARGTVDVFDSTRAFRRTVGKSSNGLPIGVAITAMGATDDGMWVFDQASGKSYTLDLDGHVLDTHAGQPTAPPASGLYWVVDAWTREGSRAWMESATTTGIVRLMREGRTILRTRADGRIDTVGALAIANAAMVLRSPAGDVWFRSQPWSAVDLVAFATGAPWGYILRQSNAPGSTPIARVTLERFSVDSGRPSIIGSIDFAPRAVTGAMVKHMVDSIMPAHFSSRFVNLAAARRAVREVLFVPATLPYASKLIASSDGQLYVEVSERDWLVYDSGLRTGKTITLPGDVRLEDAQGGRLVGVRAGRNGSSEIVELRARFR